MPLTSQNNLPLVLFLDAFAALVCAVCAFNKRVPFEVPVTENFQLCSFNADKLASKVSEVRLLVALYTYCHPTLKKITRAAKNVLRMNFFVQCFMCWVQLPFFKIQFCAKIVWFSCCFISSFHHSTINCQRTMLLHDKTSDLLSHSCHFCHFSVTCRRARTCNRHTARQSITPSWVKKHCIMHFCTSMCMS